MCRYLRSRQQGSNNGVPSAGTAHSMAGAFYPALTTTTAFWLVLASQALRQRWEGKQRGETLQRRLASLLISGGVTSTGVPRFAHHSLAIFAYHHTVHLDP